jgi:hypothetical protein
MPARNLQARIALASTIATAVQTNLAGQATVPLDGVPTPPAAIVAVCTAFVAAVKAVAPLKAAWQAAVAVQRTAALAFDAMEASLHRFVVTTNGPRSPVLVNYGWGLPAERKATTALVKAVAVEQRVSTRKARGTGGKRQKARVKGQPVTLVAAATTVKPPTP